MCPWHEKSGDIAMIWAQKPLNRAYRPAADGYLADGTAQRHRPGFNPAQENRHPPAPGTLAPFLRLRLLGPLTTWGNEAMGYAINHVHIRALEPNASAAWYEKHFGAKVLSAREVMPGTITIVMELEGPARLNISSQKGRVAPEQAGS